LRDGGPSGTELKVLTPLSVNDYALQAFKDHLLGKDQGDGKEDGKAAATVNLALSAVRSFLAWAYKQKLIIEVPQVDPVPRIADEVHWLEPKERNKLLRTVAAGRKQRDLAIVELFMNSGLRVSELNVLRWRDIKATADKGELTVRSGKGGKWRTVPLNKIARQALSTLQEIAGSRYAPEAKVTWAQGDPDLGLSVRAVQHMVQGYGKKAGIGAIGPHTLRHTFARSLAEKGVDAATIQRILGHSSLLTRQKYLVSSASSMRAAVDRLCDD